MRWATFYIRSFHGFSIVKCLVKDGESSYDEHMIAIKEATEQDCLPSTEGGHPRLIQEIVPQDEWWYNKLFTEEQAREWKMNGSPVEIK